MTTNRQPNSRRGPVMVPGDQTAAVDTKLKKGRAKKPVEASAPVFQAPAEYDLEVLSGIADVADEAAERAHAHRRSRVGAVVTRRRGTLRRALVLKPLLDELRTDGITTLTGLADELNARGIRGERGGVWTRQDVARVLEQIAEAEGRVPPAIPRSRIHEVAALLDIIEQLRADGITQTEEIAVALTERGVPNGKQASWWPQDVERVLPWLGCFQSARKTRRRNP